MDGDLNHTATQKEARRRWNKKKTKKNKTM